METSSDGSWIEDPKGLRMERPEGEEVSHVLPRSRERGAIPAFQVHDDYASG
jgi:hypothetical protein